MLKDYLNSEEGIFDKNKLFVDFTDGETYTNNRGFVISFKKLTGNLDNQITLEDVSMTSCKDPKMVGNWECWCITLDDNTMRGMLKKLR